MKKILLSLFIFLFLSLIQANAATTWYVCSGATNINSANFTSIIGDIVGCIGATGTPTTGDSIVMNASSGALTLNVAPPNIVTFDQTGNTSTLAWGTQSWTITGLWTVKGPMTSTSGIAIVSGGVTLAGTPTGTFPIIRHAGAETFTWAGFTWPGNVEVSSSGTITLGDNGIISGSFSNGQAASGVASVTFAGAHSLTIGNLINTSTYNNRNFTFPASQTLTITNGMLIAWGVTIKSGTSSTAFTLTYTGTPANMNIQNASFTDVTASGQTLYDYNGGPTSGFTGAQAGTLTRTTNIISVDERNLGLAVM